MNIPEYETLREDKIHVDALFPYTTYLCSIPLDFCEVPRHWHQEMEIIYIKKGKGIVSLDFDTHYVETGDIIIVLPGQLHGISQFDHHIMEYENIIFSMDMFLSKYSDASETEFFTPLLSGKISFDHLITKDESYYPALSSCLDRADHLCASFPKGFQLAIKSYFYEFFYVLYTNSRETGEMKSNKNLDRLKDVLKYIETNYNRPISIEEIAAVCGFSASHFMKFFKNVTGTSFIAYLNHYRLSMASRMLISSEDSILAIAQNCGFENLSYFNRCFKSQYKTTPSAYRTQKLDF